MRGVVESLRLARLRFYVDCRRRRGRHPSALPEALSNVEILAAHASETSTPAISSGSWWRSEYISETVVLQHSSVVARVVKKGE